MWTLCFILCSCNIALSVHSEMDISYQKLTSTLCSLAILYLIFSIQKELVGNMCQTEPLQTVLLRKQIHAMNWRLLSNKANYLSMLRGGIRRREPTTFHRCKSDKSPESGKNIMSRRWKSSSELSNYNSTISHT